MNKAHHARTWLWLSFLAALWAGCTHDTLETRRHEKWMAYAALPQAQREAVDQEQIRVGMTPDAVYIAWGKPDEALEAATPEGQTTWRYGGPASHKGRHWIYRESRRAGLLVLERSLERDPNPQNHVQAEIIFWRGKVAGWRTLPKP